MSDDGRLGVDRQDRDQMTDIQKWETDKYFILSWRNTPIEDGSIGSGSMECMQRFDSAGERELFISFTERCERYQQEIADLKSDLRELNTLKGARKNLRRLREQHRITKETLERALCQALYTALNDWGNTCA